MKCDNNEMGAWFPKDGGGDSNLWANGEKPNVKGKTHKVVKYPFFPFVPNHLEVVEEVISLG